MLDAIVWMSLGAAGVMFMILMKYGVQHGWAALQSAAKARATATEAEVKQKFSAVLGDLDGRIRDVVHSELARLESDIAALKAKVGGLT